ncbi:hypothetical protein CI109_104873 [Kwoniella shandongensis]|uniref:Uncharacterized protein n=1 Tax=Kwoniella shandongensis TaxID=1734106 RepID=A0A5M6BSC4_9TREE|nr:uncharacterized protein CI109_006592 [Kwoniella shandongensis]KAA5525041.1 hypothetical protein CI109_006592 [Kwoniella shandongensis]
MASPSESEGDIAAAIESSSPSTPPRAGSPSPHPNGYEIPLETSLSNISLGSGSRSPPPTWNGYLSPHLASEREHEHHLDEGDIGVGPSSPPRSPSPGPSTIYPIPRRSSSRKSTRTLTGSPSPSRYVVSPRRESSPSKIPLPSPTSLSSPPTPSHSSLPSRQSRSPTPPPQPRFFHSKPTLPTSTTVILGNTAQDADDAGDMSAPFESIPLHSTTPPPPPISVPLPSSPRGLVNGKDHKRQSWGGFGMTQDGQRYAVGQVPDHPQPLASSSKVSVDLAAENGEAGGIATGEGGPSGSGSNTPNGNNGATPRMHAPPAHPFPWPIPTSPQRAESKRLSVISNSSSAHSSSQATPAPQAQHPQGLGVKGVSTFEKVYSHTRPSWLPPKDKVEDATHLHQWEEMMAQSREHEKERQKAEEARRLEKEKRLAMSTPRWETVLNDKEFSVAKIRSDLGLRKLWFEGIPSHLRGKAWGLAIGNPLAASKDAYRMYASRAKKAIESGRFPQETLERIEKDLDETLVTLKLFGRGSPVRDDLKEMLCAWVVYRSDEGLGYAPYINLVAAMFLLVSPPSQAFISLINLLSRPCLRAFFTETTDEIDAYYRVLENLQADQFPKIYANCKSLGLRVPDSWFRSLLVEQLPFEASCRLWDQIVLDGDGYIFRATLAIFGFLEPRLYYPDHDEILSILEGHNPAALAIRARERERARLRGEPFDEGIDGKLSSFGLNESALFGWLEEDGWKERGFERLVVREMPD